MSYIDKIKVDGSLYSVQDDRLPSPEVTDEGKVITVDASGNYELNAPIDAYTKTETDAKLALKADASSVYTKSQVDTALGNKQDTLTAGSNISIDNNVISAIDTTYTAGANISIDNGVISVVGQLGVDDYDDLDNKPIINQDLDAVGFTPVANTYYKHTGTTGETYVSGKIYFYDGEEYKAIDGSGSGMPDVTDAKVDDVIKVVKVPERYEASPRVEVNDVVTDLWAKLDVVPDFDTLSYDDHRFEDDMGVVVADLIRGTMTDHDQTVYYSMIALNMGAMKGITMSYGETPETERPGDTVYYYEGDPSQLGFNGWNPAFIHVEDGYANLMYEPSDEHKKMPAITVTSVANQDEWCKYIGKQKPFIKVAEAGKEAVWGKPYPNIIKSDQVLTSQLEDYMLHAGGTIDIGPEYNKFYFNTDLSNDEVDSLLRAIDNEHLSGFYFSVDVTGGSIGIGAANANNNEVEALFVVDSSSGHDVTRCIYCTDSGTFNFDGLGEYTVERGWNQEAIDLCTWTGIDTVIDCPHSDFQMFIAAWGKLVTIQEGVYYGEPKTTVVWADPQGGGGEGIPQLATPEEVEAFTVAENAGKIAQYTGIDYKAGESVQCVDRISVALDKATFISAVSDVTGEYLFEYIRDDQDNSVWTPDVTTYGITITGTPEIGDSFIVTYNGESTIAINDNLDELYFTPKTSDVNPATLYQAGETYPDKDLFMCGSYPLPYDSLNEATFANEVNYKTGHYDFNYNQHSDHLWYLTVDGDGENETVVDLADYGIVKTIQYPDDTYQISLEYTHLHETIDLLTATAYLEHSKENGSFSFTTTSDGLIWCIENRGSGSTANKMFAAGMWDTDITAEFIGDRVSNVTVTSVASSQSIWGDWIAKTTLPHFDTALELVPRLEVSIDFDTYMSTGATKGSSVSFTYTNNSWCSREMAAGTPVDSTTGTSPMTVYYNTLLSVEEIDKILRDAGIPTTYSQIDFFGTPAAGSSGGFNDSWGCFGYGGQYALVSDCSSGPEGLIWNGMDMAAAYGISKGWIQNSNSADTTTFVVDPDFRNIVDALFSLTPFGYIYTPISLEDYGITVTGTPLEGDIITISIVDNGLQTYELYRVQPTPVKEYIDAGDTVSTLYFDTTSAPKASDFDEPIGEVIIPIYVTDQLYTAPGLMGYYLGNDNMVICCGFDMSTGLPKDVVYSSVASPELGIEESGWQMESYTFDPSFVCVDGINAGEPVSFINNIEVAKQFVKATQGDEPVYTYSFYKFYQSPNEGGGSGATVVDFGTMMESSYEFEPTSEQLNTLKNGGNNVVAKISYAGMIDIYAPLTVSGLNPEYESNCYIFSCLASTDPDDGAAQFSIFIVEDYDGQPYGYVNMETGGGGDVVTSIDGHTGSISVGNGVTMNGNQIENSGVTSFGSQTGSISVGTGLNMNGSTLECTVSSGVTSIGGQTGAFTLGSGLSVDGNNELSASASIPTYSPITLTNDTAQGFFSATTSADSQIIGDGKLFKIEIANVMHNIGGGSASGTIIVGNSYSPVTYAPIYNGSTIEYAAIYKDFTYDMNGFWISLIDAPDSATSFFAGQSITVTRLI